MKNVTCFHRPSNRNQPTRFTSDVLYFQAHMKFPADYPYSPPSIRFLTKVWHPNVYEVRIEENFILSSYLT